MKQSFLEKVVLELSLKDSIEYGYLGICIWLWAKLQ